MKEYVFKTKTIGNYKIEIVQDDMSESPRECDNLGTMACWHRRCNLGDNVKYSHEELERIYNSKEYICLPLYLYEHSGITMNTIGFSCPWDSGQVGIIFVSKAKVKEEYNWKVITKERENTIKRYLKAEVEIYDQFLTGEVYGYQITNMKTEEITDSCYGFYGEIEYCMDEAIHTVQWNINNDIKTHAEKVKTWIKNRVPLEKRLPLFA
jgi:hypothetical protein